MATLNLPSFDIPEMEAPTTRKFIKMPDNKARDQKVGEIKAQLKKVDAAVEKVRADIEVAVTPKEDIEKRNALSTELKSIIKSQNELKKKKQSVNEQIRATDAVMKRKINEIHEKTSKHNFKTVKDIEERIRKLESNIESGSLMLVEEKRAIKEISSLNKLKKDFLGFEQTQKSIDADKSKIAELKASLSSYSNKEIQAKFEEITAALDALTEKNKGIDQKRKTLFDSRSKLYSERDALRDEMRSIYDAFDVKFKKFKADMDEERKRRENDEKAYNLYLKKTDLLDEIKEIAEEAQQPVDASEIAEIKTLIAKLDTSSDSTSESGAKAESDDKFELPEGAELIKKSEEAFFLGTGKSKKKKSKQKKSKTVIDPALIGSLVQLEVAVPSSAGEIDETVSALKEKLTSLEASQEEKNKEQISKAQAKIDKLTDKISKLDIEITEELEKEKQKKAEVEVEVEAEAEAEKVPEETEESTEN